MIFTSKETGRTVDLEVGTKVLLRDVGESSAVRYVVRLPLPGGKVVNDITVWFSTEPDGKETDLVMPHCVADEVVELL